jgi:P4 family phage/plasmid primase-like protien
MDYLTDFEKFKYFGVNVSAYTNKDNEIKKKIIAPSEKFYKGKKHYYKGIYNMETKQDDIIPNGISIITTGLSTIDIDKPEECDILKDLLLDCSFIVKTKKGYHCYFNKEEILPRNKQCDVVDINLKTLFFIPEYQHNVTGDKYNYSIYKNNGVLVDMPHYAIEWCKKVIESKENKNEKKTKKVKKENNQIQVNESNKENKNENDNTILIEILNNLKPERFNSYNYWFIMACIFVNENYDLKIFDNYCMKYKGYNKENNDAIINGIQKSNNKTGYTEATLYYWLKKDNYDIWVNLQSKRKDLWFFMDNFNHYHVAQIYYQNHPNKFIYSNKNWYILNSNNIYNLMNDCKDILFNDITQTIEKIIIEQKDIMDLNDANYMGKSKILKSNFKNIGNSTFKKGVIDALCGFYSKDDIEEKLNNNINLLAFDNKVFDIKTGEYRNIEPSDLISMTVGYTAPTCDDKYRKEVFDLMYSIFEDKEVIDYWFNTIGSGMFGNKSESMFIHTGSGRNGKGVLGNILEKCMGSYYQQADSQLLTGESKSATNSTLANAKYSRMLVLSEPDDTDDKTYKLKTSLVKSITGGDTITVRDLYKSNISFKPKFSVILQCNKKPDIDKLDIAIEQRLKVIHYPFTFVENPTLETERKIDTSLKDKCINNMDFIKCFMQIILEYAYKNSKSNTTPLPSKVKEQNEQYFDDNNPVKEFLRDSCEITKNVNDKVQCRELYNLYNSNNYKTLDEKKFSEHMTNLNKIQKKKCMSANFYLCIKLKPEINNNNLIEN